MLADLFADLFCPINVNGENPTQNGHAADTAGQIPGKQFR